MHDPNVLYSALSSFARVLYREKSMINRGSVDSMALQRYKSAVVKCLDHNDPSIRRRALDVISALIDETNVETLIPEILAYVRLADAEFRSELIAKIYSASQRFAPSAEWNFDTVHDILVDSGNYVSSEILASFCELIGKSVDLQPHAVSRLTVSVREHSENQSIVQVSAFVLGEFARVDDAGGIVEALRRLVVLPQTTIESKLYILMAIGKLANRFGRREEAIEFFAQMETSNHVELQQRAGELRRLLSLPTLCSAVLAPVVVAAEAERSEERSVQITTARESVNKGGGGGGSDDEVDDLLLLVMGESTKPAVQQSTASVVVEEVQKAAAVGGGEEAQKSKEGGGVGGRELLRKGDFVVFGQVQPNPKNPKQFALRLLFYNTGMTKLTEFKVEYQIQPGWQLDVRQADGNVLEGYGSPPLTQILYLLNQTNAPFSLHLRVAYLFGSQPLRETGTITKLV
jgi:hypothetical protein